MILEMETIQRERVMVIRKNPSKRQAKYPKLREFLRTNLQE